MNRQTLSLFLCLTIFCILASGCSYVDTLLVVMVVPFTLSIPAVLLIMPLVDFLSLPHEPACLELTFDCNNMETEQHQETLDPKLLTVRSHLHLEQGFHPVRAPNRKLRLHLHLLLPRSSSRIVA